MTFETIVQEHRGAIQRMLRKLRVPDADVPDVYQCVLLGIHRGLPVFDPGRGFNSKTALLSWIFAICDRQAANHRRGRRRRSPEHLRESGELDKMNAGSFDPEASLIARQNTQHLADALDALPAHHRQFLLAYEVDKMPIADLANQHGIPLNTAWNRLRLARQALRAASKELLRRSTHVP